jgi:hypothetical protein
VLAIPASSRINTVGALPDAVGGEIERQARERPRLRQARLFGELARGASRGRGPQHPESSGGVGLREQAGGERLAGARQRLDALHSVAA